MDELSIPRADDGHLYLAQASQYADLERRMLEPLRRIIEADPDAAEAARELREAQASAVRERVERPHGPKMNVSNPRPEASSTDDLVSVPTHGLGPIPWRPTVPVSARPQPPYGTNPYIVDQRNQVFHPVKELQIFKVKKLPDDTWPLPQPGDVHDIDDVYAYTSLYLHPNGSPGTERRMSGGFGGEFHPRIDGTCTISPTAQLPVYWYAMEQSLGAHPPDAYTRGLCKLIVQDYTGAVIAQAERELWTDQLFHILGTPLARVYSPEYSKWLQPGDLSVDVPLRVDQVFRVLLAGTIVAYDNTSVPIFGGSSLSCCQLDVWLKAWNVDVH